MGNLIQMFWPKQADIDKILKVIQRKVLKGTHLLVEAFTCSEGTGHPKSLSVIPGAQGSILSPPSSGR